MLRLLGLAAQATLLLLAGYNAVIALWGWKDRKPAPRALSPRRLRVVVPAHNEATVISGVLRDLGSVTYPPEMHEIWVLADRCTDDTASISRSHGVRVTERTSGPTGKGPALAWYLEQYPLLDDEALLIVDADNRVPPEALTRISDELEDGHQVVQCYLDVANPDESLLAEASALTYWAGNRMVQLARTNLGWPADLGGTGMAMTKTALEEAGGFGDTPTEDQDLGIRLHLAGHRVEWLHDVRVRDEKPPIVGVAVRQRARWMAGKRTARRRHLRALVRTGTPASLDLAVRLIQPGRSFLALLSGLLTVAAAFSGWGWLLPWQVWAGATAVQVLEPVPFLAKEGVGGRRLLRYPLMALIAALWLPVRLVSSRLSGWYHTPHRGVTTYDESEQAPVSDR